MVLKVEFTLHQEGAQLLCISIIKGVRFLNFGSRGGFAWTFRGAGKGINGLGEHMEDVDGLVLR